MDGKDLGRMKFVDRWTYGWFLVGWASGCGHLIWHRSVEGLNAKSTFFFQQDSNFQRFVEVGRVVLLKSGPSAGKIAVIAEIIDHNRAIIDGPTTSVPRQAFPYRHLSLTPLKITGLPRAAGTGAVRKLAEKEAIAEKWEKSSWAQKRRAVESRRSLNDFGRFSVMLAKKQRRDIVRKAVHKAKKSA
ncbi:hypothetical protein H0H92_007140 [Tricholoma furcatifolium]|nr:hypothetical protein H0H92_007140 [Tricholoma furcatifolium]